MPSADPSKKAADRRAVQRHLYAIGMAVAQDAATIAHHCHARGERLSADEAEEAALFLVGMDRARLVPHGLDATRYFQITPAGMLAEESGR